MTSHVDQVKARLPRGRAVACLLAAAAVFALVGSHAPARADESADVKAARALLPEDVRSKGVLTAGMPLDFEPFNYLDEKNDKVGLDVDVFKAIAEVLGVKPEIERLGFASIIPAVSGGRVDVGMSAMGILKPRLQQVSFVRYGHFSNGLIVRAGNPSHLSNSDACGHTIAAEKGTQPLFLWQDIAKKCEADGKAKIEVMVFDGKGPQVLAVETGRAEAAAVGYATAIVAAKHSGGKLEAAPGGPVPGGTVECGISYKKGRDQLGGAIEAALKVIVANGTYDKIFDTWSLKAEAAPPAVIKE
ncbi:MAG: ABC transporter substrate-binding protein [Alphaproteobacteria bacterium]